MPADPPSDPLPLRLIDGASAGLALIAGGALVLLAVTVVIDVVGRTLFSTPLTGALETTAYWWMPMLTLLAFGYTEKAGEHIRVTLLLDTLPERFRAGVEGVFSLLGVAILLMLAWYSWVEALRGAELGRTTASTPPVPIWPFAFVAVAGLAMLALQGLATAWRRFAVAVRG